MLVAATKMKQQKEREAKKTTSSTSSFTLQRNTTATEAAAATAPKAPVAMRATVEPVFCLYSGAKCSAILGCIAEWIEHTHLAVTATQNKKQQQQQPFSTHCVAYHQGEAVPFVVNVFSLPPKKAVSGWPTRHLVEFQRRCGSILRFAKLFKDAKQFFMRKGLVHPHAVYVTEHQQKGKGGVLRPALLSTSAAAEQQEQAQAQADKTSKLMDVKLASLHASMFLTEPTLEEIAAAKLSGGAVSPVSQDQIDYSARCLVSMATSDCVDVKVNALAGLCRLAASCSERGAEAATASTHVASGLATTTTTAAATDSNSNYDASTADGMALALVKQGALAVLLDSLQSSAANVHALALNGIVNMLLSSQARAVQVAMQQKSKARLVQLGKATSSSAFVKRKAAVAMKLLGSLPSSQK
jgi:hypothetical protein